MIEEGASGLGIQPLKIRIREDCLRLPNLMTFKGVLKPDPVLFSQINRKPGTLFGMN